ILDEPASGLDPRARVELRELVRTLQGLGKTIIISSHILLELAEMCTNVAIMQAGQLVIAGDVATVTHQLGGGRQIEIRLLDNEHINQAIEIVKASPDITNTLVSDNDPQLIKADFSGDDQSLHTILAGLMAENVPVVSFAPRTGGGRLEEVFM